MRMLIVAMGLLSRKSCTDNVYNYVALTIKMRKEASRMRWQNTEMTRSVHPLPAPITPD
jgi:hypothetical protein